MNKLESGRNEEPANQIEIHALKETGDLKNLALHKQ